LVANEVIKRHPKEGWAWFLAGFHAVGNLFDKKFADDLWDRCVGKPQCPPFLSNEKSRTDVESVRDAVKKSIPEEWVD
jgi:hypothetical protein